MVNAGQRRHGLPYGAYAERRAERDSTVEQCCAAAAGPLLRLIRSRALASRSFVQAVGRYENKLKELPSGSLSAMAEQLRDELPRAGFAPHLSAKTFALIRALAERTLGMRHFDVQVIGGWILLNGIVAEMDTGEGKTLTATLPACTAALARIPVHVVTVNDYLARRDAEAMKPLYSALGLTVGVVGPGMDASARRQAYACDITYCTNKELVFDYLKDRIVLGPRATRTHLQLERLSIASPRLSRLLLRGLHFAIVDEADSVLIDEARTPLIISRSSGSGGETDFYQPALALAAQLQAEQDFAINDHERSVTLTGSGCARLAQLDDADAHSWQSSAQREELVRQALTAQYLMQRDVHYLVKDNKIQIIDEYTGRVMGDRSWEHGLHQLIELKEGCKLTSQFDPLSRITYQRFFRRYRLLCGMTGTAREVRGELWSVYRLPVVAVPPNRPRRRVFAGEQVFETATAKWRAVVARVASVHRRNQPILIGTRTVGASEQLSALLTSAGLPHRVLNAKQDSEEAEIIARAGEPGRITVATNMAGRGTDIRLTAETISLSGLYVLGTERHEAQRIDRQLFGRCGRQGDPGTYEMMVSLEDELFSAHGDALRRCLARIARHRPVAAWLTGWATPWAQHAAERWHKRIRRELLRAEDRLESALAFTGHIE